MRRARPPSDALASPARCSGVTTLGQRSRARLSYFACGRAFLFGCWREDGERIYLAHGGRPDRLAPMKARVYDLRWTLWVRAGTLSPSGWTLRGRVTASGHLADG